MKTFWDKVEKTNTCWNWTASCSGGSGKSYGQFWFNKVKYLAHRFSYELHKGKIPEGLQIDHLCRNRKCVNPDHLEAVTHKENLRRGERAMATHCKNGHERNEINTRICKGKYQGDKQCKVCDRIRTRKIRGTSIEKYRIHGAKTPV